MGGHEMCSVKLFKLFKFNIMNTKAFKIFSTIVASILYLFLISTLIYFLTLNYKLYTTHIDFSYENYMKVWFGLGIGLLLSIGGFIYAIYSMWFKK